MNNVGTCCSVTQLTNCRDKNTSPCLWYIPTLLDMFFLLMGWVIPMARHFMLQVRTQALHQPPGFFWLAMSGRPHQSIDWRRETLFSSAFSGTFASPFPHRTGPCMMKNDTSLDYGRKRPHRSWCHHHRHHQCEHRHQSRKEMPNLPSPHIPFRWDLTAEKIGKEVEYTNINQPP